MIYRVLTVLAFNTRDPADDIIDKIKDVFDQAITVNPGQLNEELSFYTLEQCFHDQDKLHDCTILEHDETH